jgi:hypothetical protein
MTQLAKFEIIIRTLQDRRTSQLFVELYRVCRPRENLLASVRLNVG